MLIVCKYPSLFSFMIIIQRKLSQLTDTIYRRKYSRSLLMLCFLGDNDRAARVLFVQQSREQGEWCSQNPNFAVWHTSAHTEPAKQSYDVTMI